MKRFSHSHIQSNLQQATTQNVKSCWLLTGGGRLWAKNHRRSLPIECLDTYTLCKILYCLQFLSYVTMYVQFHVVTKILHVPLVAEYIRDQTKSGCFAIKNNKKLLNCQPLKVVSVALRRWSFTRVSNCKTFTGKVLVFWIGGR